MLSLQFPGFTIRFCLDVLFSLLNFLTFPTFFYQFFIVVQRKILNDED